MLAAVVALALGAGRSLLLLLDHLIGVQLLVGNGVGRQLSGADYPGALILIVLGAVYFLDTVVGHLIQEAVLVCIDVQGAGLVGGRLGCPGDEVQVCLREQGCDLLVEVQIKGKSSVPSGPWR